MWAWTLSTLNPVAAVMACFSAITAARDPKRARESRSLDTTSGGKSAQSAQRRFAASSLVRGLNTCSNVSSFWVMSAIDGRPAMDRPPRNSGANDAISSAAWWTLRTRTESTVMASPVPRSTDQRLDGTCWGVARGMTAAGLSETASAPMAPDAGGAGSAMARQGVASACSGTDSPTASLG